MTKYNKEDLVYMAAIIDGEGSISFTEVRIPLEGFRPF
jgi:hypothetical protein